MFIDIAAAKEVLTDDGKQTSIFSYMTETELVICGVERL